MNDRRPQKEFEKFCDMNLKLPLKEFEKLPALQALGFTSNRLAAMIKVDFLNGYYDTKLKCLVTDLESIQHMLEARNYVIQKRQTNQAKMDDLFEQFSRIDEYEPLTDEPNN